MQYLPPPSIVCIEQAAAAKAFLEMHYASIHTHYENLEQDPTHLRRLRSLKTKGTAMTMKSPYERTNMHLERPLGKGSFGLVELVKEASTNRVYAMKIMHKSAMINNSQEAHLKCERDLLVEFAKRKSDWIVPLIQSFQDHDNLYLVMSFMEGGDFLGLLLRDEVLAEEDTRFYVAEMICAVEEVHRMGWIHRDLKPDNFLIDGNGHLKLSDFGLAFSPHWSHQMAYYTHTRYHMCERVNFQVLGDEADTATATSSSNSANTFSFQPSILYTRNIPTPTTSMADILMDRGLDGRTYRDLCAPYAKHATISKELRSVERAQWRRSHARSCVGTSQYMAPEVISSERYDKSCDWWSIGCILYECLYGSTPFYDSSREKVKEKALRWPEFYKASRRERVQRPQTANPNTLPPASFEVKHLLRGMINWRHSRLSGQEIRTHPWFYLGDGIHWDNLIHSKAPWKPEPRRAEDLCAYFEPKEQIGPMEDKFKRPRDKVLRDPICGPAALEVRMQTAFLGYTFRRSDTAEWVSTTATDPEPSPKISLKEFKDKGKQIARPTSLIESDGMAAMRWMESAGHVAAEMRCSPIAQPVTLSA